LFLLLLRLLLLSVVPSQGDIEKVASRSPEQLTQLFEQISGSDALAKDYSEASAAKEKAEAAAGLLFAKKKAVAAERKQKKEQKEEAERHMAALEEQVRGAWGATRTVYAARGCVGACGWAHAS
jgi:chromosome segregation ATPase